MQEDKFEKIDIKLDKMCEHLASIDITIARQQVSLDEHISRTELLEKRLDPVEKNYLYMKGSLKFIATMSLICTFILILMKLLSHL